MFSKSTEYALRAAIFIAQKGSEENKLGIDEISRAIGSPRPFTARILQLLTKDNKIVSSVRRPNGGFYIADKAKKLPSRCILEAMGEDEILEKCVLGLIQCSEKMACPMHAEYKLIKQQLIQLFENKTIELLVDEIDKGARVISKKRPAK
ncbi:RrF2 family transcriptional regulator [Niastella sp. OAS944]|uniref:RrF2 family transcriptional regulator n=1 Tax=Niastella sp. OAS944 TaxID=2664089 RepID=UPI003484F6C9|nr:Rrf2 family protein [Chitinophagaceae bacterium OAS944]